MRSSSPVSAEVRAWCAAHGHTGHPDDLMVRTCAELTELDPAVPVDLEVLASIRGVRGPVQVVEMGEAGCIYIDGDHFRIRLRASDPPARRRFTLAHEICHTFFDGTRLHGVVDAEVGRPGQGDDVERLCDLGAAELLLPRKPFMASCPAGPDFDDVERLAEDFDASLEATASRIVALGLGPRQLVRLEPKLTMAQARLLRRAEVEPSLAGMEAPAPRAKLRVCWATGGNVFVPPNKSADEESALAACITNGDVDAVEDPGITGGEVVRVVARHLPYWREGTRVDRVLAFLYSE